MTNAVRYKQPEGDKRKEPVWRRNIEKQTKLRKDMTIKVNSKMLGSQWIMEGGSPGKDKAIDQGFLIKGSWPLWRT